MDQSEIKILNFEAITPLEEVNKSNLVHSISLKTLNNVSKRLLICLSKEMQKCLTQTRGESLKINIDDIHKIVLQLISLSNKRVAAELEERGCNIFRF